MHTLLLPGLKTLSTARAFIMLLDVINTFFTAIPQEVASYSQKDDHDNPALRKRERTFEKKKKKLRKHSKDQKRNKV